MNISTGLEATVNRVNYPKRGQANLAFPDMDVEYVLPPMSNEVWVVELRTARDSATLPQGHLAHALILTKEPKVERKNIAYTIPEGHPGQWEYESMMRRRHNIPDDCVAVVLKTDTFMLEYRFSWTTLEV